MHGPIRDRIEELLRADSPEPDVRKHLASCVECARELAAMRECSGLFNELRSPAAVEPAAGFYGRVLQRIEEQNVVSIWSLLTDSAFGKWLVYASLAIALLAGTWLVGVEREDGHIGSSEPVIAQDGSTDMPVTGDEDNQRDAVLVNLATYHRQGR